ncbi:MAG TPA: low molecular weight protein-tyrosine-phosphatase [Myxococcales bacterium LLY-WYZ-16_1]|nr:low molecular weight protein-tyrosine-phosphatase [Myxococcales bacterium LLY-WYZ-16_1]
MTTRVLFVCLGNICRSPTAEAVFRELANRRGLAERFEIDSAGTGSWHSGAPPDARMQKAAAARGYRLTGRARQVAVEDFERFDLILTMDESNRRDVLARAPADPGERVQLFRRHDPAEPGADVPDPYYGGPDGFRHVVEIVERNAEVWLDRLGLAPSG